MQSQSGWGTVTPAACATFGRANSSARLRLTANREGASVRTTQRCKPASGPPATSTSMAQFSWMAPPESLSTERSCTPSAPARAASQGGNRLHRSMPGTLTPRQGPSLGQRRTRTGTLLWVSTLVVSLPISTPRAPRRPCEAIMMRSQPLFSAASTIAA